MVEFGFISTIIERMAITKAKKTEILSKLKDIVTESKTLVFLHFAGLPVSQTSEMRKTLREKGVGYVVAKKSLSKRAFAEAGIAGTLPEMPGEFALAYGVDQLDPAREIFSFQKKFDKKVIIVGGVFDGAFMNADQMTNIATIPGMQTLRAQFVNLINSPLQGLVIALNAIADKGV